MEYQWSRLTSPSEVRRKQPAIVGASSEPGASGIRPVKLRHERARITYLGIASEASMEEQTCPKCGTRFPTSEGWAKTAVSLTIPAPAVPDMATQVRCPKCHHLFADSEVRHLAASHSRVPRVLVIVACLILVVWAIRRVF
jgi:hypothetical protein